MADPQVQLNELAEECLVRLGADLGAAPGSGGSGVWIAPGIVLTCAHVVPAGVGSAIQVAWSGRALTGTVTDQLPGGPSDGGLWPFPDLAVVAVADAPDHPCVRLSEAVPVDRARLVAFGHSATLDEGLRPTAVEGRMSGWHAFGDGRMWQFKENELVEGMSGGPVLDLASGMVCAVTATSLGVGDRGGYLVPVSALRRLGPDRWRAVMNAHDRFHAGHRRWTELQGGHGPFPGVPLRAAEEAELLGFLAELPPPDHAALLRLYTASCEHNRPPAKPLKAYRDVALALMDVTGPDRALPLLRMVHQLAGPRADPGLRDWVTGFAARLGRTRELKDWRSGAARAAVPRGGVVSVQIMPGWAKVDRYQLTVRVRGEPGKTGLLYCDEEPRHTLGEAKKIACEKIREALCWLQGNALVEFIVPFDLFDEPFDELVATKPYTNIGRKYRVVLRDYDRLIDPSVHHDWQRRWKRLRETDSGTRWIICTEDLSAEEFSAELEGRPDVTVIALTRRPSSSGSYGDMLRVALDSGVPVAIWRRDTCPEHDAGDVPEETCSGRRFRTAFGDKLQKTPIRDLPETVRLLRNRAVARDRNPADHDCRGTVLLWDDPEQSAQLLAPVVEPRYDDTRGS
ncbi:hypothetical protein Aph01nite_33930 [Acrocarpospora phusangensis]|uniref:Serine protease n=1 Tax=Acrocarpospora phusangensis TaxID=1070424 RepID=A0A919UP77_9ACTN|nr:trypsin-like peptidase domain-containing protein [Acrocarpospora phusangensis]GIH25083.1 hypothetical protein Aph01nite_33930 [Acrocarpospora phusangensis]